MALLLQYEEAGELALQVPVHVPVALVSVSTEQGVSTRRDHENLGAGHAVCITAVVIS